ncbi:MULTISPECIES: helix-turn-helix domain-containing protein [Planktothrix]|uniref:helix-turn-helix domain-containing protein n=1 Tax=Planktothrix TaxID=54304 RepID=UPI0003F86954|nr:MULTISPECIES: helix-turn-helix transcriptional regulator [Planktothrix]
MNNDIKIQASSGNIFQDLGFPNADEMLMKAELVRQISEIIDQRELTQVEAAKLLGIDQPKVSALIRGKLSGFSIERLLRFLNLLGCDIEIVVKKKQKLPNQTGINVVSI